MIAKFKRYTNLIFILVITLVMISCDNRELADPPPPPGSPIGEYEVELVIIRWIDDSGTQQTQLATTDCDRLSTIEFNSNNTLEIINSNVGNDDDCSNSETILGSWEAGVPISGSFTGSFTLNSTFNGLSIYNGVYNNAGGNADAIEIRFTADVDGVSYNYEIDALGI